MLPIIISSVIFIYIYIIYLIFSNKINKQDSMWKKQWEIKSGKSIPFFKNNILRLSYLLKKTIYFLIAICVWGGWMLARLFIATSLDYKIVITSSTFKMGLNVLISPLLIIACLVSIRKLIAKEVAKIEELSR